MPGDNPNILPMEGLPLHCFACGRAFPAGSNHPDARGKGLGPHRYCPSCGATRDLTEYVWGTACDAIGEWSFWRCRRLLEETGAV